MLWDIGSNYLAANPSLCRSGCRAVGEPDFREEAAWMSSNPPTEKPPGHTTVSRNRRPRTYNAQLQLHRQGQLITLDRFSS